tara:strand:+ start:1436 stop:1930 length:495 start_codon:yes stop_codon:yes gene_type:complete
MKKIKIAACLMVFAFLFTGCKKEEIEGGFYETKLELSYLIEYSGADNGTTFHPFEELDCELYIEARDNSLDLGNTSKFKMYSKYINEEGETCSWSKDDNPDVLNDWEHWSIWFTLGFSCSPRYIVIEITQDGKKYYGWMCKRGDTIEMVVSKVSNHILAMGCKY